MSVRGYRVGADWSRAGTYEGTYEDVTSNVDNTDIEVSYGRDSAEATSRSTAGKLTYALNNRDRIFSLENTASPLYGQVTPGTPTILEATYNAAITTLFDGRIESIEANPTSAAKTVSVEALDAWGQLGAETLSTPLYQGLRTGDAIGYILDEVGWPADKRDLDPGATVMPWWWVEGDTAADAVDKLIASEGPPAIAYVQGGIFTFRDRYHRILDDRSTTSQGTFTHLAPARPYLPERVNLVPNPSFEVNTTGWGAGHGSLSTSAAQAYSGTSSMLFTASGTASSPYAFVTDLPVTEGLTYTGSYRARRGTSTTMNLRVRFFWRDSGGSVIGSSVSGSIADPGANWGVASLTATAPSGAVAVDMYLLCTPAQSAGVTWYIDAVMLEEAAAVGSYFDGASPNGSWAGTAHASASTQSATRVNLLTNPSFETDTTSWSAVRGSLARSTTTAYAGSSSGQFTVSAVDNLQYIHTTVSEPMAVGESVTAQARVRLAAGTSAQQMQVALSWRNAANAQISLTSGTATAVADSTWTQITVTGTAPADTVTVVVQFMAAAIMPMSTVVYYDALMVEKAGSVGEYFDGDTSWYEWSGTAHASTSRTAAPVTGDYLIEKDTFEYDHGLRNIANTVTFAVGQRAAGDLAEVWSSEDPISVAAGETLPVEVQASDPFFNAVTPEQDVDYTLASGTVTVTLSRTSGQAATIFITAGSNAVITRLALRATPVPVVRTVKVEHESTTSISTFGRRAWTEDVPYVGVHDAKAIAQRIVAIYGINRPFVTFTVPYAGNLPDRYLGKIVDLKISDRITVRNDVLGINEDYVVERITHSIRKLGAIHRLELGCQVVDPTQPSNIFTFGVAGKGFDGGAFGVDGIDNPDTVFLFDVVGQGFNDAVFGT